MVRRTIKRKRIAPVSASGLVPKLRRPAWYFSAMLIAG
ncbi:hypothetical protein FHW37_102289 [Neorhizobium alkalisoli]|uniref:Uncharacterized protein n=1 Tax=Neorhizobium alkalisoli TaxID=528178 RepID=A0A561R211_9HYPH|nr:hypothetical protein FHW37_102289 [Neorhizobium alkalisoli]